MRRHSAAALQRECDILRHREIRKQCGLLIYRRDSQRASRGRACCARTVCAVHRERSGIRRLRAGDHLDQRGLPRPVLPQQRMHFARAQLKRHAAQRLHTGEGLDDGSGLEQCHPNQYAWQPAAPQRFGHGKLNCCLRIWHQEFDLTPSRRDFLAITSASSLSPLLATPSAPDLPRWRGFNLQEKFTDRPDEWAAMDPEWGRSNEPFVETDFEWMAQLGLQFRAPAHVLPLLDRPVSIHSSFSNRPLRQIDQAVRAGQRYGVHRLFEFPPRARLLHQLGPLTGTMESLDRRQGAWTFSPIHWTRFARNAHKGIPGKQLSLQISYRQRARTVWRYYRYTSSVVHQGIQAIREADFRSTTHH